MNSTTPNIVESLRRREVLMASAATAAGFLAANIAMPPATAQEPKKEESMRPRIMRASARPAKKAPVWQDVVFFPEQPSRLTAVLVSFTPAARTNWHTHPVGQVLYVVSGIGRYQLEGEAVQALLPGDTVVIPPNARHWHGGAPDRMMVHLAMSETNDKGQGTNWLEPVSDADYLKAPARIK